MYTDANVSVLVYVKSRVLLSNDKRNADYPDSLSESKLSCSCCEQTKCSHMHHYSSPGLCSNEAVYNGGLWGCQMPLCVCVCSGVCVCISTLEIVDWEERKISDPVQILLTC